MALLILLVLIAILCFVIDDHEEIAELRRRMDSPMYGPMVHEDPDDIRS